MEELYEDQETIIQQLRLLLAAKEEELSKMRGMGDSGGGSETVESVADQLIGELEDKKKEVIELHARMEEIEAFGREKLSKMAAELDEKDKLIESLQGSLSRGHGDDAPADAGDADATGELEGPRAAGSGDAVLGPGGTAITRSDLEQVVAERTQLQEELGRLKEEIDSVLNREAESRLRYEGRIAELEQQVGSLRGEREAGRVEVRGTAGAGSQEPGAIAARGDSSDNPDFAGMRARIRTLEHALEERDLSYRTVQAHLHRLKITQQMLRGVCTGLGVLLICVLSIKTKQPYVSRLEAASLPLPVSLTESTAGVQSEASPSRETPPVTVREPEPTMIEEDLIRPAPVLQAAAPDAGDKAEARIAYTVQKGDSLWLICKRMLGNGEAMAKVAQENRISDPRALKVGDVIYLSRR